MVRVVLCCTSAHILSLAVARHLNSLSLTATPPSYYVQPTAHNAHLTNMQQYHSQYSEYAPEISHLASPSTPYNDRGYWEAHRNEAVRYIGQQGSCVGNVYEMAKDSPPASFLYDSGSHWGNHYRSPSSYQPTPFAQSVFQHTAPSTAYPTPPPPGIRSSSSSLAMALGEPSPKPVPMIYSSQESPAFFDDFLAQQTAELKAAEKKPAKSTGLEQTPRRKRVHDYSPDPLALPPQTPQSPSRKRKAGAAFESPIVKRVVPSRDVQELRTPTAEHTATSKGTPTPRARLQAYVELPPVPKEFLTPLQKGKGRVRSEDADLSGIGHISEDGSPGRRFIANAASPEKRANGDRDSRGRSYACIIRPSS